MKTADVLEHFKTQYAVAAALRIKQPSVANWGDYPPPLRQLQLEAVTGGALRAEPSCDCYRVPTAKRARKAAKQEA